MVVAPGFALRTLRGAFEHLVSQMEAMHGSCQIKPSDVNVITTGSTPGAEVISLDCAPIACRVPDRASHSGANFYVVFTGSVQIASDYESRDVLLTHSYATNFGYFLVRDDEVSHVLGGHYDFAAEEAAHPHAHIQLRSQADLFAHAQARFSDVRLLNLDHDFMLNVFNRARVPTAQMDFLSFMVQICADHLVDNKSPASVRERFAQLVASCSPLLGYNGDDVGEGCGCRRSPHWYPA